MSVKRESTVHRFVSERKTQVAIEQTRFLNTVFLYSEFNASPGLLRATAGYCGLLQGICPPCQSRGWGICKFWAARGPRDRHLPTPNFWHARGFRYQNITTQRILLEKHADWLTSQGQEKIEEVCKGMFSILCMHFFMHCLLSQKYIAKSGAIDVNQRLYGYWIKFLWTLCEEHPFIFIKLFITVNFTAQY